jgi:ApbE superfamily uncharacterized protein (UPF0280 family)
VREMADATREVGVGPMAAVAGAIAESVGKELLPYSDEVIVENGGDIFLKTSKERFIGVYAGKSKFTKKIAFSILPDETPLGVCTSSGTVGHSLSFGYADGRRVIHQEPRFSEGICMEKGMILHDGYDPRRCVRFEQRKAQSMSSTHTSNG